MAVIAGLLQTFNASTNELANEYQESVFIRNSKGLNVGTTLFGLMSRLRHEPAENIEFNWFERDPVQKSVFVNGASFDNASTILNFTLTAAGSTDASVLLQPGTVLHHAKKSTATGSAIGAVTNEHARVTAVNGSNITVARDIGSVTATGVEDQTVKDDEEWIIVSLGKLQGSDPVAAIYEDPETINNYIQTFNATVEVANAFKGSVLRTDIEGPLQERRTQALERISRDIEFAFLFGTKLQGSASVPYLTGGILGALTAAAGNTTWNAADSANGVVDGTYGILKGQISDGNVSKANLDSWFQRWMVNGSDAKLLFAGPTAYAAFSAYANNATNGYRIMQSEMVYGMHISTINTPFGEVDLVFHPLMKEARAYQDAMLGVDLAHLVQKDFEPLFLEPNVQAPGNDSYKEQFRAKLGLKLKFVQSFGAALRVAKIT